MASPGVSISSQSTQYILAPVRAWQNGFPYNPSSDTVQMAFTAGGTPVASSWAPASWAGTVTTNGYYLIQCLVGPASGASGTILPIGAYSAFVKIFDNPEVPVLPVGVLTITP